MSTVTLYDKGIESLYEIRGLGEGKVRSLNLHMNAVASLEGAEGSACEVLEELDLSSNALRSLRGAGSLMGLRLLNVSANGLRKIPDLSSLIRLERFNGSYNSFSDIAGLAGCQALATVDLEGNAIASPDSLKSALPLLPSLRSIAFQAGSGHTTTTTTSGSTAATSPASASATHHTPSASANPVCSVPGYRALILKLCPHLMSLDRSPLLGGDGGAAPTTTAPPLHDPPLPASGERGGGGSRRGDRSFDPHHQPPLDEFAYGISPEPSSHSVESTSVEDILEGVSSAALVGRIGRRDGGGAGGGGGRGGGGAVLDLSGYSRGGARRSRVRRGDGGQTERVRSLSSGRRQGQHHHHHLLLPRPGSEAQDDAPRHHSHPATAASPVASPPFPRRDAAAAEPTGSADPRHTAAAGWAAEEQPSGQGGSIAAVLRRRGVVVSPPGGGGGVGGSPERRYRHAAYAQTESVVLHPMESQTEPPQATSRSTSTSDLLDIALVQQTSRALSQRVEVLASQNQQLVQQLVELQERHAAAQAESGMQKAQESAAMHESREAAAALRRKCAEGIGKVEAMAEELEQRSRDADRLRVERHKLELQVAAMKSELTRREADLQTQAAELRQTHQIDMAKQAAEATRAALEHQQALSTQAARLAKQHDEAVASLRREHSEEVASLSKRLESERASLSRTQQEELEAQMSRVRSDCVRKYEKALREVSLAYREQKESAKLHQSQVRKLEARLGKAKEEHAEELDAVKERARRAAEAEKELVEHRQRFTDVEVGRLRDDLRQRELAVQRAEAEAARLREQLAVAAVVPPRPDHSHAAPEVLETLRADNADLQHQLRSVEGHVRSLAEQVKEKEKAIERLLNQLEEAEEDLHTARRQCDDEEAMRRRVESNLQASLKETERTAREKRRRLEDEIDAKAQELACIGDDLRALHQQLSEKDAALSEQRAKAQQAQEECGSLRAARDSVQAESEETYKKLKVLAKSFQKHQVRWEQDRIALGNLQVVAESDKVKNKELEERLARMEDKHRQLQDFFKQG